MELSAAGGLLNHSIISGVDVDAKKTGLLQMSLSHWLGKFTLFAPAVSCLAQDGAAGGYNPFAGALLSWFGDVVLSKCEVLDPAVRGRVNHMEQTASERQ